MTYEEIVLDIINEADYDLYKSLMPETAEDPEEAEERLKRLTTILKDGILQIMNQEMDPQ
jgi:hypothetical protein